MPSTDLATLPLEETMAAGSASDSALSLGEGYTPARRRRRRGQSPQYLSSLNEALHFVEDVYAGEVPLRAPGYFAGGGTFNATECRSLEEALTTSDFTNLFGDIIDRQLLARYQEIVPTWRQYANPSTVADFRTVKRFAVDGAESTLATVGQLDEYPEAKLTDSVYSYAVAKYGRRIGFSWETIINDDLDAFSATPDRLARAARRTEEKFATQLFASSTGPNATFFSTGHKNKASGAGSALSITSLQSAMTLLLTQTDTESEPIQVDAVVLVIPPNLLITAENILNATELWLNAAGGDTTSQVHTVNWMRNRVKLVVDYYLPIVDTTSGTTAWYLFADPNSTRPAMELGHLRGHDAPEIFQKIPTARRVGGGEDMVSFDNDSIDYKVRHVMGGTLIDFRAGVAMVGA